jgi:hypothetical protein
MRAENHPQTPHGAAVLEGVLRQVRDHLKDRNGSSLILDYRVRQAIFLIESTLGGLRHECGSPTAPARSSAAYHCSTGSGNGTG